GHRTAGSRCGVRGVSTPRRRASVRRRCRAGPRYRPWLRRIDGRDDRRCGNARRRRNVRPHPADRGTHPMTRVLIVDDEGPLVRALAMNLTARGYEVIQADSGTHALTAAAADQPDVILLDLG